MANRARKQNITYKEDEDMAVQPEVRNAELSGEIKLVRNQVENLNNNFIDRFLELNKKLDDLLATNEKFVTKSEYDEHVLISKPIFKWVEDRQAVEKFIYGIIGFLGVSNFLLLVKIIFFK